MALTADETAAPMSFSVALKMRDFPGLQARLASGEHIGSAEMDANYRPLAGDYDKVSQWLAAQGLTVTFADATHTVLIGRASVAQVSQAFGAQMARVSAADGEYTAAISAPRIPAGLSDSVLSVNGLQPQLRLRHIKAEKRAATANPADLVGNSALVTPNNIIAAYHVPGNVDGTGQTIAIVDAYPVQMSDLAKFWTEAGSGQKASNVSVIMVDGTSDPLDGNPSEAAGDVDWAGALAPGAKIRQYVSSDPFTLFTAVLNDALKDPTLSVVSVSYLDDEALMPSGQLLSYSQTLAQLAAAGVSVYVCSGDGGSNNYNGIWGSYDPTAPLAVCYPASDPNVTSVGGTRIAFDASWNATAETVWDDLASEQGGTGGGLSTLFLKPGWQTGGSLLSGQTARCVPDVTAISVAQAPSAGIAQGDGTLATGELFSLEVLDGQNAGFGGTSEATPIWAGIGALINQARSLAGHGPIGLLGPSIYPLQGTAAFNDITSGTNGAYSAGPGYDLCSGLGSPNVAGLVTALATVGTQALPVYNPAIPTAGAVTYAPSVPVMGGSTVTMGVSNVYSNLGTTTYQWTLNGAPIPGATGATYTIAPVQGQDRGLYAVELENDVGTNTVGIGTLAVIAPTVAIVVGAPTAALPGTSTVMSVAATSSGGPLTYQWTFDGTPIAGALQSSLSISNITAAQAGDYTVVTADSNGITVTDLGYLTLAGANYLTPYVFSSLPGQVGVAVTLDAAGNVYALGIDSAIRKITPAGVPTLIAGIPGTLGSADGVGSAATFNYPAGIAVDSAGYVYVADTGNSTIRRITPDGIVSTFAGQAGNRGYADGTGASALFSIPQGIAIGKDGTVYVADSGNSVIRTIAPGGVVTTLAGNGHLYGGNVDGLGTAALFENPCGIAVDGSGTLYVADTGNSAIRTVTPKGLVTTLAGNSGVSGSLDAANEGDTDGVGRDALFRQPQGVAVDAQGNVFVSDTYNYTIRKVTPGGIVTTLGGVPTISGATDGTGSAALFNNPAGLAVNANGVLYVGMVGQIRIGVSATESLPALATEPPNQTVANGSTVTFTAASVAATSFQWFLNGTAIPGATGPRLVIPDASAADAGDYACTVTNAQGSATTVPAALSVVQTADPGRLINLSCRAPVGTGSNVLIVGFASGGGAGGAEPILVRASGPALAALGVPGTLPDPALQLFSSGTLIGANIGWKGTPSLAALFSRTGAFAWTNPSSLDSALSASVGNGTYSAVVTGATGDTGVALAEIYDATAPGAFTAASPRLTNLSARGIVNDGSGSLIAGFVIGGSVQ